MRVLPPDVTINPMPDDFTVSIERTANKSSVLLKAKVRLSGRDYELGLRPVDDPAAIDAAALEIKAGVWQLTELDRLGREDLMRYAAVDRHQGRSIIPPQMTV